MPFVLALDSKHPSGMPSTVWKPATLLDAAEVKVEPF